ncbi:kinase [Leucobacter sp. Psy1]|nr:PfkB family carbohydrate kinase [Leucobacter sp. Psy1]UBH06818.1 kinase [Leucobacter sp. Psy1]
MSVSGLFVGLATLDVIHRIDETPGPNEKVTATQQFVAAGGPAANAAVTFAALGGRATLLTALGSGPVAEMIRAELRSVGVRVEDVAPNMADLAPVSSVSVLESTGERSVVGGDAARWSVPTPSEELVSSEVRNADVVLLDGHHPEAARAVAGEARRRASPTVLDAGRWKPVMSDLIPQVSDVVASADFRMPGTTTAEETGRELVAAGVPVTAVTSGSEPITWWSGGSSGIVAVPDVEAVDTLGAGDVFHGAYAFALARSASIKQRLVFASEIASIRCAMVGPRSWLNAISRVSLTQ